MLKELVKKELLNSVKKTLGEGFVDFDLNHPQKESFGDFTLNVALKASPVLKQKPLEIAKKLASEVTANSSIFEKAEAVGPGFVNLTVKTQYLIEEVGKIICDGDYYGKGDGLKNRRIVIEYTDPNPFKEFHIGHLYSNIVGESIAKLKEALGARVFRADYFGDVGLHVAKAIWGLLQNLAKDNLTVEDLEKWVLGRRIEYLGQAYALGSSQFEENESASKEIKDLNAVIFKAAQEIVLPQFNEKPQINFDSFTKDSPYNFDEIKKLYSLGRTWSLEYFEFVYKRLGTKFDGYYPESRTGEYGYGMVLEGLKKGIFEKGEKGAIIFPGSKYGLHDRVFINFLGLPTYEAKDFGNAVAKNADFPHDESVIVTGNEINEYFQVVLKALSLLYPDLGEKTVHIGHGMVRLLEGKMSSRTGRVLKGEWLLDEAKNRSLQIIREAKKGRENKAADLESVAEVVGQGAVKYALLRSAIGKDIEFDFSESVSFDGNCGPYLQYTYARARSVLRKSRITSTKSQTNTKSQNSKRKTFEQLKNLNFAPEELSLLRTLYKFPEVLEAAALNYQPNLICGFLFDLARKFNSFYNNIPILHDKSQTFPGQNDSEKRIISHDSGLSPWNLPARRSLGAGGEFGIWNLRLGITAATAQVLKNGLALMGIRAPERM